MVTKVGHLPELEWEHQSRMSGKKEEQYEPPRYSGVAYGERASHLLYFALTGSGFDLGAIHDRSQGLEGAKPLSRGREALSGCPQKGGRKRPGRSSCSHQS